MNVHEIMIELANALGVMALTLITIFSLVMLQLFYREGPIMGAVICTYPVILLVKYWLNTIRDKDND